MAFEMPFRGDKTAPEFDPAYPRSLLRFFEDLEECFLRARVTSDDEKKRYALRYVSFKEADTWEELDSFASGTFDEWKAAILALYPEANEKRRLSRRELEIYVQQWRT